MNRRSLIKSLLFAPLIPSSLKESGVKLLGFQKFLLPVGADLSYTSLEYALNFGEEHSLGRPKSLLIGPENKFLARELLLTPPGAEHLGFTFSQEFPICEVVRRMPQNWWQIWFERGVVESQAP